MSLAHQAIDASHEPEAAPRQARRGGYAGVGNQAMQERLAARDAGTQTPGKTTPGKTTPGKTIGGGTHRVRKGDNLRKVARKSYDRRGGLWAQIREANPDKIPADGDTICVGEVLDIPKIPSDTKGSRGGKKRALVPEQKTTDFGVFNVYPDSAKTYLPQAKNGVQNVTQKTFEQYRREAGDDPGHSEIDALKDGETFDKPRRLQIMGEGVLVSSKAEAQHALRMLQEFKDRFGIRADSDNAIQVLHQAYSDAPELELVKLKAADWDYRELHAVHRAMTHFASILGPARQGSALGGSKQGVDSFGKSNLSLEEDEETGEWEAGVDTLGTFFEHAKQFTMYAAGRDYQHDYETVDKELEATAVHELTHGLMLDRTDDFVEEFSDFWVDAMTPAYLEPRLVPNNVEQPPTDYGWSNAEEDLADSVAMYFVERNRMANDCPERTEWITDEVASWRRGG